MQIFLHATPSMPPPSPCIPPRLPDWRLLLRMTRPGFLLVTLAGCLLGFASAATAGPLNLPTALATLLLALMAHAGANVLNDYHDARNGADAANAQGLFPFSGGSRLIQQGAVSEVATGRWAALLLLAVMAAGLWLAAHSGSALLLIGAAGLLLGWAYSAPPLALMSRGLGELAVAGAWWLVVVGADYVQRGALAALPSWCGLGLGLLITNILLINGFPDAPADARVGKRTLVVRLGPQRSARLYLALALLAHSALALGVAWGTLPVPALWGGVSLPLSIAAAWLLARHAAQPAQLRPAIALTIAAAIVHALALAAGLVLGVAA